MKEVRIDNEKRKKQDMSEMTKDQMIELMEKMNRNRKDNLESRKSALNILIGAIPVGGKTFAIVPLDELHIDDSYQRKLQNHVKIIAREWDFKKCDALKINFRDDGFFYVWDGQHRLEAAKMRGIKFLLCDIIVGLTQAQEAELFGCQGIGLKKPNPYEIFKANVCAGEEIDTAIKNMCDRYDLTVNRNGNIAGNLSCLTLVRDIFGKNDAEYLEWVLELLHKSKWNEFPQSHSHKIINSLYEIRKGSGEEYDFIQRKIISHLKKTTPDGLLIKSTIRYPQYKDESKRIKLYLLDIVSGDDPAEMEVVADPDRFIA